MRRGLLIVVTLAALAAASACGNGDTPDDATTPPERGPRVVASTSWTGAYAKAAGAEDVRVIAPPEFQHPPDYEPKPSDLVAVGDADFIVVGGIERFADRIRTAAGGQARLVEVQLRNTRPGVRAEVSRLAELFGTQAAAEAFLARFDATYERLGQELRAAGSGSAGAPTVAANRVQAWWAELAGLRVVATFPNEPLSPQQVADAAAARPDLVFDNANLPGAAALAQEAGAQHVLLTNFPGRDLDLVALLETNAARIRDALNKRVPR